MTAASSRRSRNVPAERPEHALTLLKLSDLRTVAESKYLTTSQVARIAGVSDSAARRRLRDLQDLLLLKAEIVPRLALRTGETDPMALAFGSAPKVWVPTVRGIRALEKAGMAPDGIRSSPAFSPSAWSHLAHELAVRDTRVWLAGSVRRNDGHELLAWDCRDKIRAGPSNPDAWFAYSLGGPVLVCLIEADMGTNRSPARWKKRLADYAAVFADSERHALKALTGYRNARLLITVPDAKRADAIAGLTTESPAAKWTWIAERNELEGTDMYSPIWTRPGRDGRFALYERIGNSR